MVKTKTECLWEEEKKIVKNGRPREGGFIGTEGGKERMVDDEQHRIELHSPPLQTHRFSRWEGEYAQSERPFLLDLRAHEWRSEGVSREEHGSPYVVRDSSTSERRPLGQHRHRLVDVLTISSKLLVLGSIPIVHRLQGSFGPEPRGLFLKEFMDQGK